MVKNTKKAQTFRPKNSLRERGYAIMTVIRRLAVVPTTVTRMVIPYARPIFAAFFQRYA